MSKTNSETELRFIFNLPSGARASYPTDEGTREGETRPHPNREKHARGHRYVWVIFNGNGSWHDLNCIRSAITSPDTQLSKLQREILGYLSSVEKLAKTVRRRQELRGYGIPWSSKEFLRVQGLETRTSGTISGAISRLEARGLLERQQVGTVKPRTTHLRLTDLARQFGF